MPGERGSAVDHLLRLSKRDAYSQLVNLASLCRSPRGCLNELVEAYRNRVEAIGQAANVIRIGEGLVRLDVGNQRVVKFYLSYFHSLFPTPYLTLCPSSFGNLLCLLDRHVWSCISQYYPWPLSLASYTSIWKPMGRPVRDSQQQHRCRHTLYLRCPKVPRSGGHDAYFVDAFLLTPW